MENNNNNNNNDSSKSERKGSLLQQQRLTFQQKLRQSAIYQTVADSDFFESFEADEKDLLYKENKELELRIYELEDELSKKDVELKNANVIISELQKQVKCLQEENSKLQKAFKDSKHNYIELRGRQIVKAKVIGYLIQKPVLYLVRFTTLSEDYEVKKRYNQFENLRSNIAKLKLANSPTEFPEKLIFGNRDEELIKKRVEDLNQYLEALLALNSPLVQQELFSFIEKSNTNIDSV